MEQDLIAQKFEKPSFPYMTMQPIQGGILITIIRSHFDRQEIAIANVNAIQLCGLLPFLWIGLPIQSNFSAIFLTSFQ